MSENPKISFIIPAFNETDYIKNTLNKLHRYCPSTPYEVIIVDNGSTDNTKDLARTYNDQVLSCPNGTISAVRNHGVSSSKGEILVFIDADVELTLEWQNNIEKTVTTLKKNPLTITGSRCTPPNNNNTINTHWFNVLTQSTSTNYINSGHLITTKLLFEKISGFDETLKTAEDHDFCVRAKESDAIITPDPKLKVIHDGYPSTYTEFIKRERWHGREDFESFSSISHSKIALITIFHIVLIAVSLMLVANNSAIEGLLFYAISMMLLSLALTLYKFKKIKLKSLFKTSIIHYFYLIGRTLSLFDRITLRYSKKFR